MTSESPNPIPVPPRKWVPRYRVVYLISLLPGLLVGVVLWLDGNGLLPTYTWSGKRTVALDFDVRDGLSGRPLEGVLIQVNEPDGEPVVFGRTTTDGVVKLGGKARATGRTGTDGRTSLVGQFGASGTTSILGMKYDGRILPFQYSLTMPGYYSVLGGAAKGYAFRWKLPHPRYTWGLTPVDSGTDAVSAR
jgi:hypothetical protein